MKKLLYFLVVLMFTSCAALDKTLTNPVRYEIEHEIGGVVKRSITATSYEVKIGKEIVEKQTDTNSHLFLYKLNDKFFWKIQRQDKEVEKSFFPKNIHFKVDNIDSNSDLGIYSYYGNDVNTGERYHVITAPWTSHKGYFYILGNTEKQIIYSIGIMNINTH